MLGRLLKLPIRSSMLPVVDATAFENCDVLPFWSVAVAVKKAAPVPAVNTGEFCELFGPVLVAWHAVLIFGPPAPSRMPLLLFR